MADLNTNKILFKSDEEIRKYSREHVEYLLNYTCPASHEQHDHDHGEGCGCDAELSSFVVKKDVEENGLEKVIDDFAKTLFKQKELDPNFPDYLAPSDTTNTSWVSGPPKFSHTSTQCKLIRLNFCYETGMGNVGPGGSTGDPIPYMCDMALDFLNEAYSHDKENKTYYGNRKQRDCKIRFERLGTDTVLAAGALSGYSGYQDHAADFYASNNPLGKSNDAINIQFVNFNQSKSFGAYALGAPAELIVIPVNHWLGSTWYRGYKTERDHNLFQLWAHEMGHALGLEHTFGTGSFDPAICTDDFVSDTPMTKGNTDLVKRTNTCNDGLSMNENYLDYASAYIGGFGREAAKRGDLLFFTEGQCARMNSTLENNSILAGKWINTTCSSVGPVNGDTLAWPCPVGHNFLGFMDPSWTENSSDSSYSGHKGMDIGFHCCNAIPSGGSFWDAIDWTDMVNDPIPVTAASDGTVIFARDQFDDQCHVNATSGSHMPGGSLCSDVCGTGKTGGKTVGNPCNNYMIIDHGDTGLGYKYTLYAHLAKGSIPNSVTVGSTVSKGDRIGYVGSSGFSSGPHLHFEVATDIWTGNATGITGQVTEIKWGSQVDPFLSESGKGSNTKQSLWDDQCHLPIYQDNAINKRTQLPQAPASGVFPKRLKTCGQVSPYIATGLKLSWPCPAGHTYLLFRDPPWTGTDDDYPGHTGTDICFHTQVGSWKPQDWNDMVSNPVDVLAAAPGIVVWKNDQFKDQCSTGGNYSPFGPVDPHNQGGSLCDGWKYNNCIIIDHGEQKSGGPTYRYTGYWHLAKDSIPSSVAIGATVNRGDRIAYVGSSGNSNAPHLHFSVCTDLDPWPENGPGGLTVNVASSVDPFLSTAALGGGNTGESLWEDQCALPIYNNRTPSGNIPPKPSALNCGTTTTAPPGTTTTAPPGATTTTTAPPGATTTTAPPGGNPPGNTGTSGPIPSGGPISCVKTISVDVQKAYLGENINYRDIIVTQAELFFTSTGGLTTWLGLMNTYKDTGQRLTSLTIGSVTFGNCKIIEFEAGSSPDAMNNAIQRGSVYITVEEIVTGDLSNISGAEYTDIYTQLQANGNYLDNVSETFNYSVGLNNQYNIHHSVSVSPADATGSGSAQTHLGITMAKVILDGYISSASNISSIHSVLRGASVTGLLSSSVNMITGEATYTRKIDTLSNITSGNDASYEYEHNVVLGKEGIITVTETGKIISLEKAVHTAYATAVAALPSILGNAATRCSSVHSVYSSKMDNSSPASPLNTGKPVETKKSLNEITQEVSYSITFSDDPNIGNTFGTDRTLTASRNKDGLVTLSEKASFFIYGSKGQLQDNPVTIYNNDSGGSLGRLTTFWGSSQIGGAGGFKEISTDVSYNPNGKNLSYSKSFMDDKSIINSNGIKKYSSTITDKGPVKMVNEFPIAGWKMIAHKPLPGQSDLGERSVTVTCTLDRASVGADFLSNPSYPAGSVSYAANQAQSDLLGVFADLGLVSTELVLTECGFTVDAKRNLILTATAQYRQAM